jgi:hypothetical protein
VWLLCFLYPAAAKSVVEAAKNIFKAAFGKHGQPESKCSALSPDNHTAYVQPLHTYGHSACFSLVGGQLCIFITSDSCCEGHGHGHGAAL